MATADSIRLSLGNVEDKLASCEALASVALLIDGDVGSLSFVFHGLLKSLRAELELSMALVAGKAVSK